MNIEDYQNLVARFCEQERIETSEVLRDGLLTIDGRGVALHFEPGISADHILVRAELGGISERIKFQCMQSMLIANHHWGLEGTLFSLQPESLEAVLTVRMPVNTSTTASELRHAFNGLGATLKLWSDTIDDLVEIF